jgi:sulfoxide reductase catalytic subunit YedY
MLIKTRHGWDIPESEATPEGVFLNRRALMAGGAGLIGASLVGRAEAASADPTADLYPAKRNESYKLDRAITDETFSGDYNNYYEFGTSKSITAAAEKLKIRPWSVKIDGLVEKPLEIAVDDLLRKMPLEERLYRHRCVEAWSMAVPWTGFPVASLLAMANPTADARYMVMQTFRDPAQAPGQKQFWYPWPYTEGLTVEEAKNDLAFMVTGIYGKPLGNQFGAPLRLAVPWKYGFKSVKSITRFHFTDQRPKTFWEALQSSEYGFWANVNPEVAHPRWSQASEQLIGTSERRPTLLFNGYAEQVADIYKGLEKERLWA